jgi:hypothetical protein
MRCLPLALIAVLLLSRPATGEGAQDAKDKARELANEMKQAASALVPFAALPDRHTVRVTDRATARATIKSEFHGHYVRWHYELPTEELWGPLYLVGLIPADCNPRKSHLDWLCLDDAAVYDWTSRKLFVVRDADAADLPTLARRRIIMRELSDALVQRHIFGNKTLRDLDKEVAMQHDNMLAISAVIDGSAQLLADRYQAEFIRTRKDVDDAVLRYADYEEEQLKRFVELPRYVQSSLGTAVCGRRFLMQGQPASAIEEGETGEQALTVLRKRLPQTTEQILHPEKFFDKEAEDLPILIDAKSIEQNLGMFTSHSLFTRPRWKKVGLYKDTFGELLCGLMTKPKDRNADPLDALNPSYYVNEAGSGWGGDRFFLLRKSDLERMAADGPPPAASKVKGVWVTVWDTPKDRDEFISAYSKNMPQGTGVVLLGKRTAVFLYHMTPQEREEITRRFRGNPPKLQQGEKAVVP